MVMFAACASHLSTSVLVTGAQETVKSRTTRIVSFNLSVPLGKKENKDNCGRRGRKVRHGLSRTLDLANVDFHVKRGISLNPNTYNS